jgi:hypothetical protein
MGRKRRLLDYSSVDEFLRNYPSGTWKEFKIAHPDFTMTDASFYNRKHRLLGPTDRQRGPKLYTSVCAVDHMAAAFRIVPAAQNSDSAVKYRNLTLVEIKSVVKELITNLNDSMHLRLQVVELADPMSLEIRRLTK